MPRPPEYENLIQIRAFEPVVRTAGAVEGFLRDAADCLEVAHMVDVRKAKQRFLLAYEGFYSLVQAVLELYEVRTKEAGRNLAIQRVCVDLKLDGMATRLAIDAHARRNATTYRSPFPPISRAEAQAMIDILASALPIASALAASDPQD